MIETTIQLIVFTAYIIFLIRRFGVLESISKSAYALQGRSKFIFTIVLVVLAIANINQPIGVFANITTLGLFFTGATVTFKRKGTATPILHYIGAGSAIVSAMIGLAVIHGLYWVFLPTALVLIKLREDARLIWWIELAAFYSIILGYFLI